MLETSVAAGRRRQLPVTAFARTNVATLRSGSVLLPMMRGRTSSGSPADELMPALFTWRSTESPCPSKVNVVEPKSVSASAPAGEW